MEGLLLYVALFANWFLAGIAGGAAAIGTSMTAMPILILLLDPTEIVLICVLSCFFASVQLIYAYRGSFLWSDMKPLFVGCLPGIAVGTLTLKVISVAALQLLLGFILFSFIIFQLIRRKSRYRLPDTPLVGTLAGFVIGFAGAAAAVPGAPLGIYIILRGWDADRSRGNLSLFFMVFNTVTAFAHMSAGLYTMSIFQMSVVCAVGGVLGQCMGVRLGRGMDTSVLHKLILLFIFAAAFMLFWRALGL